MHYSALLGHSLHDAKQVGWDVNTKAKHNWDKLTDVVGNHVRMLNFRYRTGLKKKDVEYINALAKFEDSHTISYFLKGKNGGNKVVTSENIVIAVGGRPSVPDDIPGAKEHAITSDDIFSLDHPPGKTLCVGGSYIALECAGFLTDLGYDVTVAVRSILLRGFDRQCAEKIGNGMKDLGTKFLYKSRPIAISKLSSGKLQVKLRNDDSGVESTEIFDTVFFATGRFPDVKSLGLELAGVNINPETGKIPVNHAEQTNVSNIFAVGDVCEGFSI